MKAFTCALLLSCMVAAMLATSYARDGCKEYAEYVAKECSDIDIRVESAARLLYGLKDDGVHKAVTRILGVPSEKCCEKVGKFLESRCNCEGVFKDDKLSYEIMHAEFEIYKELCGHKDSCSRRD